MFNRQMKDAFRYDLTCELSRVGAGPSYADTGHFQHTVDVALERLELRVINAQRAINAQRDRQVAPNTRPHRWKIGQRVRYDDGREKTIHAITEALELVDERGQKSWCHVHDQWLRAVPTDGEKLYDRWVKSSRLYSMPSYGALPDQVREVWEEQAAAARAEEAEHFRFV